MKTNWIPSPLNEFLQLRIERLCACNAISGLEAAMMNKSELIAKFEICTDNLIMMLHKYMMAEHLAEISDDAIFETPLNWREHLKLSLPAWVRKRFPVKYKAEVRTLTCRLDAILIENTQKYLELAKSQRGEVKLHFHKTEGPNDE